MRTGLSDVEPGLGIKTALHVLTLILLFPLSTCNVSSTGLARKGFSIQSSRHPTCLPQVGLHPHLLALFRRCASWDDPHEPPSPRNKPISADSLQGHSGSIPCSDPAHPLRGSSTYFQFTLHSLHQR